jgi:hypothetical protein
MMRALATSSPYQPPCKVGGMVQMPDELSSGTLCDCAVQDSMHTER